MLAVNCIKSKIWAKTIWSGVRNLRTFTVICLEIHVTVDNILIFFLLLFFKENKLDISSESSYEM